MSENTEQDDLKAQIEALSNKNRELLGELKVAKQKAKGVEIDPTEYANLQSQVESLTSDLDKTTKAYNKEVEGLRKSLSEKDTAIQSYLVDNGLSDALVKVNVRPEMMPAVKAMLKVNATVQNADGQYSALMGGKPIMEAVTEWAATDEGKHFVSAPPSSGSGAPGAAGGGAGKGAAGSLGGSRSDRVSAIKEMFPDLSQ
jgi:hypothetical protein